MVIVPPAKGWLRGLLLLALLVGAAPSQAQWYWQDLLLTRDQQGMRYFNRGEYRLAAQRFDNPNWRAMALYAAQQFKPAAAIWSRLPGADSLFNRGNALAHLQDYQGAADSYQLALQLRPDWPAARDNLALVKVLGAKPKMPDNYHSPSENQIGADEVTLSSDSNRMANAKAEQVTDDMDRSAKEIQALWVDRLQSTPADFLRLKFLHQHQQAPTGGGDGSDPAEESLTQ
ncbi:MAG: hypothetical protein AseanaTS_02220 [Candidatus Pelagadaptatus aseana]|uniref:tetratricopeptide repeat protein n=1 Tax=Candidatus Pelagadaptatus aseana TaxID=3120508 RepID=UPI0039B2F20A